MIRSSSIIPLIMSATGINFYFATAFDVLMFYVFCVICDNPDLISQHGHAEY